MEAKKLTRVGTTYILLDEDGFIIASNSPKAKEGRRLSTRNCQEVEHDIEKLFSEVDESIDFSEFCPVSFRLGFLRRDEVLSDRRFTEEDLRNAILFGQGMELWKEDEQIEKFIQSLQPKNEWSVEIVTDSILVGQCNCRCHTDSGVMHFMPCCYPKRVESPRFDSSGNLILRRI